MNCLFLFYVLFRMDDFEQLRSAAKDAFHGGKYEKALKCYSKALCIDSLTVDQHRIIYAGRAAANLALNRNQEAMEDAHHVIRLAPDWSKGHFRLAEALLALGRHQDAINSYQRCLQLVCSVIGI